jgi:hypothetical protein
MNIVKPMRAEAVEKAVELWNNAQPSDRARIRFQDLLGEKNIVTFGLVIGTRASDHCIVKAINRARDNNNPSYRFWRSSDPLASNAQISSKKQKTAHSVAGRQTILEEAMVDKRVAPESVMVDVPATLVDEQQSPMADAMPSEEEILVTRFAAGPARKTVMVDMRPIVSATLVSVEVAIPQEDPPVADDEPMADHSIEAIVKLVAEGKDDIISAKNVAIDAKDAVIASKDTAYADVAASKDAVIAALMAKGAAHAEVISAKNATLASKEAAYKASIAAQAASHEAALTERQASIDALMVSNAAKDKQIERLRGALAAFMA